MKAAHLQVLCFLLLFLSSVAYAGGDNNTQDDYVVVEVRQIDNSNPSEGPSCCHRVSQKIKVVPILLYAKSAQFCRTFTAYVPFRNPCKRIKNTPA